MNFGRFTAYVPPAVRAVTALRAVPINRLRGSAALPGLAYQDSLLLAVFFVLEFGKMFCF